MHYLTAIRRTQPTVTWPLRMLLPLILLGLGADGPAQAQVINEFVANHTGSDTSEYVEIFGPASTDYSSLRILQIEGDIGDGPGRLDSALVAGATDSGGFWHTGFLTDELDNGSMTLLLVDGFTGTVGDDLDTDDDGVLDSTPWTVVLDAVSVDDGDAGDVSYAAPVLDPTFDGAYSIYEPGGASRIPNGTDNDAVGDWVRNDYDGAGLPGYSGSLVAGEAINTPGAENDWLARATPVINEVVADHVGIDDYEFIEVLGAPGIDYSQHWLVVVTGEGSAAGEIVRTYQAGVSDAGGYWQTGFLFDELDDGSLTTLLVTQFTGTLGADLDTNNDGSLDDSPWSAVIDSVAISDGDVGDRTYSTTVLDPNFDGSGTTPGGMSRIPDGVDTDSVSDWYRNDFDGEGLPGFNGNLEPGEAYNTPGSRNLVGIADYYAGVDASSPQALRPTLHDAIDDHTRYPYSSSTTDTWDILELADENPSDSGSIISVYKNAAYAKFGGGTGAYNREHSWPKTYGFSDDDNGNYPYTDCHHLFLSNVGYNSDRGSLPFGNCDAGCAERLTDENNGHGGGAGTYPGNSNWYDGSFWEVWQHRRGDIARAQLYMDVRYEGGTHGVTGYAEPDLVLVDDVGQIISGQPRMGLLAVVLEWHTLDPVDDDERTRNEVVYSFQGNRNPFVDHPEWADCLYGLSDCGPMFADGFESGDTKRWSVTVQ